VCPATGDRLILLVEMIRDDRVWEGSLATECGTRYPIRNGIPNLIYPAELPSSDARNLAYYEHEAERYDQNLPFTFRVFGADEVRIRNALIDGLNLSPNSRVLETGCGTGRDSELIARRLGPEGRLYLQDLSPAMLRKAVERLAGSWVPVEFALANACHLPFPDRAFDAVYHTGGLNTFSDAGRALREMTRVTRPGGKIVVGDESMAPWLRETEFGQVLMHTNPHYRHELPLAHLPVEARNVVVRWLLGGMSYAIEYEVGVGEPAADFDAEIPGPRGGTLRTRYYGQLEGVTPEATHLAERARARSGKSMHRWLTDAIVETARSQLKADEAPPTG
jgi:ubiquinone/menaquinone biosynthesis C-methylase UbiE